MDPYLWVAVLIAILATAKTQSSSESRPITFGMPWTVTQCNCSAILTKLDQQEQRDLQMFDLLQKKTDSAALHQLEHRISQMIDQLQDNLNGNFTKQVPNSEQQSISSDSDSSFAIVNNASVQYVDTQFGPNWIVILQRTDGSVNFARPWKDYRNGFGTVGQNFWLGLEKMHQLTKDTPYELAVEMIDFTDNERFARYDRFEVGSEEQEYPIVNLGTHIGLAGDGLSIHKNRSFSTYDSGKDIATSKYYGSGGWWYYGSYFSYLTGHWNDASWSGIWWGSFKAGETYTRLKYARMIIRAI